MGLTVLIAAYNEQPTIQKLVHQVLQQPRVTQVVIVDDGSTDGTQGTLVSLASADPRVEVHVHAENQGKGSAIRTALQHATGDLCIIQDGDLEYSPGDYDAVLAPIISGQTQACFGSRVLHPDNEYPIDSFRIGSFVVTLAANLLYGARLTDQPTCYKAFRTDFLRSLPLEANGFELCAELTAWTRKRGVTIIEVPIRYSKRTISEGKKVRWTDGVLALSTLFRIRLKT